MLPHYEYGLCGTDRLTLGFTPPITNSPDILDEQFVSRGRTVAMQSRLEHDLI